MATKEEIYALIQPNQDYTTTELAKQVKTNWYRMYSILLELSIEGKVNKTAKGRAFNWRRTSENTITTTT